MRLNFIISLEKHETFLATVDQRIARASLLLRDGFSQLAQNLLILSHIQIFIRTKVTHTHTRVRTKNSSNGIRIIYNYITNAQ